MAEGRDKERNETQRERKVNGRIIVRLMTCYEFENNYLF
jgi:hypothetical protein